MLLEAKIVHIPAQRERDADLAEYGMLSTQTTARFGEAAMEAGDPDHEANDLETSAVDTIANILHAVARYDADPQRVLDHALDHYEAEARGEKPTCEEG